MDINKICHVEGNILPSLFSEIVWAMGQAESVTDGMTPSRPLGALQNKLAQHAVDIKEAATISYPSFLETLQELNKM